MKTETSTQKPTPEGEKVVLITGGDNKWDKNATSHSAEIFLPNSPDNPCILPDLPDKYVAHTQDGGMICGGVFTKNTCRQWSPIEGNFPEKPVHEISGRYLLVSWTPVSENETFLIGGDGGQTSSTIVKPGILDGIPGFKLKDPLAGACSIPDPETDTVIITGGNDDNNGSPMNKRTAVYNENGFVEYFGDLNHPRFLHGCTSFIADKERVSIFFVKKKLIQNLLKDFSGNRRGSGLQ